MAVHLNGFGSSLCASRYASIAAMSAGTELKLPRRRALSVSSRNQRSTGFNHDDEVGGEMQVEPFVAAQPAYVKNKDPLVAQLTQRLASAPVITEWCFLSLLGGGDAQRLYEKALRDVVKYHVSMTSSVNFPESFLTFTTPMDPKLYLLWANANAYAGYRYSVDARPGSGALRDNAATIAVTWTNYGSAAATEKWIPEYQLVDFSGAVIRAIPSTVVLKNLVSDEGAAEPGSCYRVRRRGPRGPGGGALHIAGIGRLATAQTRPAARGELPTYAAGPRWARRLRTVSDCNARHPPRRGDFGPLAGD